MPSCEPRPACVTSAPETSKNWCLVGAERRMDTVPCPFRQVYILIPALRLKLSFKKHLCKFSQLQSMKEMSVKVMIWV